MKLLTLDVETTMKGKGKHASHWAVVDNKIVLPGFLFSDTEKNLKYYHNSIEEVLEDTPNDLSFVVGHNIGFDLHHLYKHRKQCRILFQQHRIWDTQLAEYILSYQQHKYASLDDLSVKYELPIKDSKVSDYFKAGHGADEVPAEMLASYLKQDVYNTYEIAIAQMKRATVMKMIPLIISQMEALHATIDMTYNGLKIDTEYLHDYSNKIYLKEQGYEALAKKELADLGRPAVNIASNKELSLVLYGGTEKRTEKTLVGMYKNGKPKYKNVEIISSVPALVESKYRTDLDSVDEEALSTLIARIPAGTGVVSVISNILEYRKYAKEYSTYCAGIQQHLFQDNFIHGNISHVSTNTGRLSSSNPNLQNITNSAVKKCFISRWGSYGCLMEFDFSQLEVAILAHISKDTQLIDDITTGTDIHSALFEDMFGRTPSKEERKWFKTLTFGLLYGAGVKTLSKNADCSVDTADMFVETFYKRYSGVKKYHDNIINTADLMSVIIPSNLYRTYHHPSETGRVYEFKEYENAEWVAKKTKRKYSFSPTELKNYPVQGLATADIVPLMVGLMFRKFKNNSNVALVNTIHDSILLDVKEEAADEVKEQVFELLNNTHVYYEKTFGVPLRLPLSVGCSVGKNWHDMTECKV